jgi:hypothetical protein
MTAVLKAWMNARASDLAGGMEDVRECGRRLEKELAIGSANSVGKTVQKAAESYVKCGVEIEIETVNAGVRVSTAKVPREHVYC